MALTTIATLSKDMGNDDIRKTGYSSIQIALHWLIAALVLFQLVFRESMVAGRDAAETGEALFAQRCRLCASALWAAYRC